MGKHTDTLTARDRCDSAGCGAQAYVRATFNTGPLTFCAHHAREHRVVMLRTVRALHDETFRLSAP